MSFPVLILIAGVFASWAVLSLLGGERQRQLDALDAKRVAEAKAAAATPEAEPPVVGSPTPARSPLPGAAGRQSAR